MAAKKRVEDLAFTMWLVNDEKNAIIVKMPEDIFFAAHATLRNVSRRGATLKAQGKVIKAFVTEYTKQHGVEIGDVVKWETLKIKKPQSTTTPRR